MVAEELFFGESSTGVSSDLHSATVNACQMIGLLGMGSSLISVGAIEHAGGGLVGKVLADDASRAEVEALLGESKASVTSMLDNHRHVVEALRDALLVRSELIGEDILEVIRRSQGDRDILPTNLRDKPRLPSDAVPLAGTERIEHADQVD